MSHLVGLRRVVGAMLYVSYTGCQWRFLPESFGAVDTRVVADPSVVAQRHLGARLTVLHTAARDADDLTAAGWAIVLAPTAR